MLVRGEWATQYLAGQPFFDKPPLVVWLGSADAGDVTGRVFDIVKRFRNRGGNLAFLSANHFFYEIERHGNTMIGRSRWDKLGKPPTALVGASYDGWERTSLYVPVKRFLETLGFDVKGEVCGCDLVAIRGEEPPLVVVGELKLAFNLELVLQGIDRSAACDEVWLAVRTSGRGGRERDPRVRKLCRLLGFGLLGVSAPERM